MDDNLVMQTQRPALTQEKHIRVLSLKEDKDRLLDKEIDIDKIKGHLHFYSDMNVSKKIFG